MTLPDRLTEAEEQTLDRRKISQLSKRKLAEAIHHNNPTAYREELFHILTGEFVSDITPWRNIAVPLTVSPDVSVDMTNTSLVGTLSVGGQTQQVYLRENRDYTLQEFADGEYAVSVEFSHLQEYDSETLDVTEYAIDSITVDNQTQTVTVDTEATPITDAVAATEVVVTELTKGDIING